MLLVISSMVAYITINGYLQTREADLEEADGHSDSEKAEEDTSGQVELGGFHINLWSIFKYANKIPYSILIIVLGK